MEMTDTELIDMLEKSPGCNLISNDGGRWAVSTSGFQDLPKDSPIDMEIISWIEAKEWKPSIREALLYFAQEHGHLH